jgi:hypothetical protein
MGADLNVASGSLVVTEDNGAAATPDVNTFWQVENSATIGSYTYFQGNILAEQSITMGDGATDEDGRLLAENGAVTLDDNYVTALIDPPGEADIVNTSGGATVPDAGSTLLLLGFGLAALFALRQRFAAIA